MAGETAIGALNAYCGLVVKVAKHWQTTVDIGAEHSEVHRVAACAVPVAETGETVVGAGLAGAGASLGVHP